MEQLKLAEPIKIFQQQYDPYLKYFILNFRVKCPYCKRSMKHAKYDSKPLPTIISGRKDCVRCGRAYMIFITL